MPTAKISKKTIDALSWNPPGPPQQFLWDSALKGFGVYILRPARKFTSPSFACMVANNA